MRNQFGQTGFTRKIVGYYLFFSVAAVTWLSLGVLTTAHNLLSSRATSSCLSRLGQIASSLEMDWLRNDGVNVQSLVTRAKDQGELAYCSIVAPDGRYLAHTTRPLVGAPAIEPSGSRLRWGKVEGLRYSDQMHGQVSEYRAPLSVNGEKLGTLRLGVSEPDFWGVVKEVTDSAPLAILLPLASVVGGALILRRLVNPFASVEERLLSVARTPHGQSIALEPVSTGGSAAVGWNRLVESITRADLRGEGSSLDERLSDALSSRRNAQSLEVLEGLREGVAVTDMEGKVEFANAAVASLLSIESDQGLVEENLAGTISEAARGAEPFFTSPVAPVVTEVQADQGPDSRTLRVERQPLDGDQERAVWSIRDVTQQKLAEKSRDQFIDAATHELRTPLANIKAYAEMLATCDLDDPEQQKEFFNTINSEATRLARFVDDLLDVSSMEVGALSIRRQNVEIERLLREAVEKVRPLMEKKSLKFEVVLPPKLGEMHLDKDKVSALVVNLLGNAAKYTPEGGRVKLKAEPSEAHLALAVSDTGVGISEEELPKVFEKFFRSEDPKVRGEAGTGLGLSLAREIARLHGGDVAAESQVGEGSTFTVTLARANRNEAPAAGGAG